MVSFVFCKFISLCHERISIILYILLAGVSMRLTDSVCLMSLDFNWSLMEINNNNIIIIIMADHELLNCLTLLYYIIVYSLVNTIMHNYYW